MTVYHTIYAEWEISTLEHLKHFTKAYNLNCKIPDELVLLDVPRYAAMVEDTDFLFKFEGNKVILIEFEL